MPVDPIGKAEGPKDPYLIHSKHHTPPKPSLGSSQPQGNGVNIQGQECYVDMGKFYGNNVWGCMDWSKTPGRIDAQQLQKGFFGQFFSQLKSAGVDKIDLSFAQIADINRMMGDSQTPPSGSGGSYSAANSLGPIFHTQDTSGAFNQPPYQVCDFSKTPPQTVAPNFLSYMSQYAHSQGIKVDLSLGGAAGGVNDYTLPGDPKTSANNLSTFMDNMGIDSVDFDIENPTLFQKNSPDDLNKFFTTLHSNLAKEGKESTATLEGGALSDPTYAPLTSDFNSKFDSLNLMLYSNSQYYLNAKSNPQWMGVEGAINMVGGDPSKIHLGFYDAIPYEDPNASGDSVKYNITPGSSRGQAAAQIYQQLCSQLQADGALQPGQSLGEPFFWIDTPGDTGSAQVMQDFYNTLKGISKTPWG